MNISDIIALGSLAVSVATAVCSFVSHKKYGRRLNKQQLLLNEYALNKQEKDESKSRCAELRLEIIDNRLIVSNVGQAEAKNIELTFPSEAIISPQKFPVVIKSISPNTDFRVSIRRATTSRKGIDVHFSWFDGRGVRQTDKQYVCLD